MLNVLKEGRLNLLGLCQTNFKDNEEFVWSGIRGVRSGMVGDG